MVSNRTRGGLDRILGKMSSPKGLSSLGTGHPGKWLRLSLFLEIFRRCVDVVLSDVVVELVA